MLGAVALNKQEIYSHKKINKKEKVKLIKACLVSCFSVYIDALNLYMAHRRTLNKRPKNFIIIIIKRNSESKTISSVGNLE